MAKNYYVIIQPRHPNLPLPAGSLLFTVNAPNPVQALRVVQRHMDVPDRDGDVVKKQEFTE